MKLKMLPSSLLATLAVLALSSTFALAKPGWSEQYDQAIAQAKAEKKHVLLDFTGSDWCGWCTKIDKEIFSQPEFAEYAKKNLVLVEIDFPRRKEQSAALKAQNEKLQAQYKIEGFPTIIVLNPEGKKVGVLGYMEGGAKAFIAALEGMKK